MINRAERFGDQSDVGDIRQGKEVAASQSRLRAQSFSLRRALAERNSDRVLEREISVSYERVGDVRLALKDVAGSFAAFEESLKIRKTLASDKSDKQAPHDLLGASL